MKVTIENLSTQSSLKSISIEKLVRLKFDSVQQDIELKDVLVFPGLINAHDHLEFNLFPCLVNGEYRNYKDWGADIHRHHKMEIEAVLKIPLALRIKWGVVKNLITGVTCVVHHGKYHDVIRSIEYPVFLNYQYLHALDTERFWRIKLMLPVKKDVMIHIGEGTDEESEREINMLLNGNVWKRNLIGIHAISMNERQSKKFKAIVWCPDSNLRLYGKTTDVSVLKTHTKILFGTDSTLSASPNLWDHLRLARKLNVLSDNEIVESLTRQPQTVFRGIDNKTLVIAKQKANTDWDSFFSIDPEDILVVMVKNKVTMIDQSILENPPNDYSLIKIGNSKKWIQRSLALVVHELETLGVALPLDVSAIRL